MAADWGPCTSTSGVHDYPVNFDIDIMDASKNEAGTELKLIYSWTGVGQPFNFICECPDTYKTEKDTPVSYTHLRAHETSQDLVFRRLLLKTAYEILRCLVGSEMCIRDRCWLVWRMVRVTC
ncbi:hypothetical protein ACX3V1_11920 [Escherichia coli]